MGITTLGAAKILGIDAALLRQLVMEGVLQAPDIVFDPETHLCLRFWSEEDLDRAREVLKNIKL
jgi:hypothetical protein